MLHKNIKNRTTALGNTKDQQIIENINYELIELIKQEEELKYKINLENIRNSFNHYRNLIRKNIVNSEIRELIHAIFTKIEIKKDRIVFALDPENRIEIDCRKKTKFCAVNKETPRAGRFENYFNRIK